MRLVFEPAEKVLRDQQVAQAKKKSVGTKGNHVLTLMDERFVFSNGELVEYEFILPLEYLDLPSEGH